MKYLIRKFRGLVSAMKAGAIVGRCKTGCYLDDDEESVVPCSRHAEEIFRLSEINQANW